MQPAVSHSGRQCLSTKRQREGMGNTATSAATESTKLLTYIQHIWYPLAGSDRSECAPDLLVPNLGPYQSAYVPCLLSASDQACPR